MVADVSDIAEAVKKSNKKSKMAEVKEDAVQEDEEGGGPKSKKSHAGAAENLVVGDSDISEQIAGEDDTR